MRLKNGFSRAEILVVSAIVCGIVALGAPIVKNGRISFSAGERSAVGEMQAVVHAQTQYRVRSGKYATSLNQLEIAEKDGYQFTMVATRAGYTLVAVPRVYYLNGRRTFYVNQSGVIRESWGERPASEESPAL